MSIVQFLLSGVCHQLPENSLVYGGHVLPICARCTGTFVGAVVALLALWAMGSGHRSGLPFRDALWVLGALGALWAVDGANSLVSGLRGAPWLYGATNALRLTTGVGCGLGLGALLYPLYHYALFRDATEPPVIAGWTQLAALLVAGAALAAVAVGWRGAPYALWAGAAVGSVLAVFALTNTVLVAQIIHRRGVCVSLIQVAPYWVAGAALGLAEMSAVALLRQVVMG